MIRPVVKWAGGKRQVLAQLMGRIPPSWNHYYEPFFGGGALFIALFNQGRLGPSTISDANPELVNLYRVIQNRPDDLIHTLETLVLSNRREEYLILRDTFNRKRGTPAHSVERAALFLYLNRHGYNGLWRVNRKGEFNVPFGKYRSPSLPTIEEILRFSQMLRSVQICEADFSQAVQSANKGDFVYFDPPYHPISPTARFTAYHAREFSREDQARLADLCRHLRDRGVWVMVSNSSAPEIEEWYHDFYRETIEATRSINSRGDRRKGVTETIITGYPGPVIV